MHVAAYWPEVLGVQLAEYSDVVIVFINTAIPSMLWSEEVEDEDEWSNPDVESWL